jgi:hypothetical protein
MINLKTDYKSILEKAGYVKVTLTHTEPEKIMNIFNKDS